MKKLGVLLILCTMVLVGCKNADANESQEETKITVVGSTALQPFVDAAKDLFQEHTSGYSITVQGGGSGTGLSQVSIGAVEIGTSDVFAEEKSGISANELIDHRVSIVGIAPVVHKDTGVTNLSKAQLIAIFKGEITNWKEVGGNDQVISVIHRSTGSGTRSTFEKWGLDGEAVAPSQEQDSSGTVRKMVAETPGAISYLALSLIDSSIQVLSLDHISPTNENITTNEWPIWSYGHLYTRKDVDSKVLTFIDFLTSDSIQNELLPKLGYLPVTSMKIERLADGTIQTIK